MIILDNLVKGKEEKMNENDKEIKGILTNHGESLRYQRLKIRTEGGYIVGVLYILKDKKIPRKVILEYLESHSR